MTLRPIRCLAFAAVLTTMGACASGERMPESEPRPDTMAALLRAPPDSGRRLVAWAVQDTVRAADTFEIGFLLQNGAGARPIYVVPNWFRFIIVDPHGRELRPLSDAWWHGHRGSRLLGARTFYGEVVNLTPGGPLRMFELSGPGLYRVVVEYNSVPPPPDGPPVTDREFPDLRSDTVRITYLPQASAGP